MTLEPLLDKIVVSPMENEDSYKGVLFIPDSHKEKPNKGKVVSVGPGRRDLNGEVHPINLTKGDMVLYSPFGGTNFKLKDEELVLISEDDILAKILV